MTDTPFEFVIWNAQQVADYLGQSKSRFLRCTRFSDGFPAPVTGEGERPRWRAIEVTQWRINHARITPQAA